MKNISMMRYITLLLIALLPYTSFGQEGIKIFIGEKGDKYDATQRLQRHIGYSVMREDPKLYASSEDGDSKAIIVAQYDVSVIVNGDMIGPFTVKDDNAQQVFDKLHTYFEPGAKVYYEKIMLVCRDCSPPKPINSPGIEITLE